MGMDDLCFRTRKTNVSSYNADCKLTFNNADCKLTLRKYFDNMEIERQKQCNGVMGQHFENSNLMCSISATEASGETLTMKIRSKLT